LFTVQLLGVTVRLLCADEPPSRGSNVPIDTPSEVVDDDETDPAYSVNFKLPGTTVNVQEATGCVTVSVTATDLEVLPMLTVSVPV
jgi:hypothetical protein